MKFNPRPKLIILLVLSLFCFQLSIARGLQVDSPDVDIKIASKGGHGGKCIELIIRSLSSKIQFLSLSGGTMFKSKNPDEQNILLVENLDSLEIQPGAVLKKVVRGFCCQASKSSPISGSVFSLVRAKNEALESIGKFIADNRLAKNPNVQAAIWAISDDHPSASIKSESIESSSFALLRKVCELKDEIIPWYHVEYEEPEDGEVFSNKVKKVEGNVNFRLPHNDVVTIVLFNEYKETVHVFCENMPYNQGKHSFNLSLDGRFVQRGDYTLKVYNNSRLLKVKKMRL